MVGWHHLLNGREFEKAPGDSKGQRSLACCGPQGHRVRHNLANKQQLCSCWPFCKSGTRQKGTTCRDSKAQLSYLSFIVYMCVCVCVCVCVWQGRGTEGGGKHDQESQRKTGQSLSRWKQLLVHFNPSPMDKNMTQKREDESQRSKMSPR